MSVASNYIILEFTPVDGKLFLDVQWCKGAQTPTSCAPACPRALPCARPDCPVCSCAHAGNGGQQLEGIFSSGLVGAWRGAVGGDTIDGSATGGGVTGGGETGDPVGGSAMAAVSPSPSPSHPHPRPHPHPHASPSRFTLTLTLHPHPHPHASPSHLTLTF